MTDYDIEAAAAEIAAKREALADVMETLINETPPLGDMDGRELKYVLAYLFERLGYRTIVAGTVAAVEADRDAGEIDADRAADVIAALKAAWSR